MAFQDNPINPHPGVSTEYNDLFSRFGQVSTALTTKADLVNGTVPASQLPSYVDDVLEFDTIALLPATGESGKIYVITTGADANRQFRWSGSQYIELTKTQALYAATGQNTDGAMTQKATTDELAPLKGVALYTAESAVSGSPSIEGRQAFNKRWSLRTNNANVSLYVGPPNNGALTAPVVGDLIAFRVPKNSVRNAITINIVDASGDPVQDAIPLYSGESVLLRVANVTSFQCEVMQLSQAPRISLWAQNARFYPNQLVYTSSGAYFRVLADITTTTSDPTPTVTTAAYESLGNPPIATQAIPGIVRAVNGSLVPGQTPDVCVDNLGNLYTNTFNWNAPNGVPATQSLGYHSAYNGGLFQLLNDYMLGTDNVQRNYTIAIQASPANTKTINLTTSYKNTTKTIGGLATYPMAPGMCALLRMDTNYNFEVLTTNSGAYKLPVATTVLGGVRADFQSGINIDSSGRMLNSAIAWRLQYGPSGADDGAVNTNGSAKIASSLTQSSYLATQYNVYLSTSLLSAGDVIAIQSLSIPAATAGNPGAPGASITVRTVTTGTSMPDGRLVGPTAALVLPVGATVVLRYDGSALGFSIIQLTGNTLSAVTSNSTFTPAGIRSAITSGSYVSGELQGTQPAGSVDGMRFSDANWLYVYTYAAADNNGTQSAWTRVAKR